MQQMVVNFANLDMKEPPALVLKNAGEEVLGFLGFAKNISPDLKYNEVSTIEFEIPEYVDGERVPFFDDVIGMRIVELVGIGQFILVNPSFNGDGIHRVKSCKGYSLEYEFARKKIAIPNGTYQFWKPYSDGNTVLDMIMELMPGWSIGSVSHSLYNKYRTFEVSNENVYNFIKGTVQQTFNCIFDFDTFTRTVNVRDANEQALEKPVVISEDNLATGIEVEEDTESIVTRLDVNGAEGVDIRDVNPCGTNKIINLDYFMTPQNFPQALIDKYYAWKELCESNRQNYYSLSIQYALKVAQRVTELARLTDLKGEMTSLENVQAVTIQGIAQALSTQADLDKANADIAAKQVEIDSKTAEIDTLQREQDTIFERLKQIQKKCSFDTYFTASEHLSLDRYIKDDEISDSTFVMSSTTDYKNPSVSTKVSGKSISISNSKIEHSTDSTGGNFYSVAGGSLSSQIDGLNSSVISATLEMRADNSFVLSAYLGSGSINGTSFPSACISCTGTASTFVKSDASIRLSIADGFAYFSLDASEYEKRSIAWDLYEYGEEILAKLSQPTYTFSISSANFFSLDEFEMFKNEITLGEKAYVVLSEDRVLKPVFIGVKYNYDEPETMELQFSNSFASGDSSFKLVDLLEQSVSLGKNLELSKYIYSSFVDSGASTGLREFMTSALDVAKNAVLSSTNQAISWDGAGFRLRRWSNDAHTAYDKEQIWMINNSIVMTDDNWATAKMALGKFHDDNFGDCWGIVAPMLVGTLLAGERMLIESAKKDGSTAVFRVDGDGCHLYNSDFILSKTVGNTTSQVILSPDIGLAIGTGPLYTEDKNGRRMLNQENANFWADDQGNLHLKGAVVATSLHIQNQTIKDYVDSESHGVASSIVNEELKNYYTKEECLQEFTITEEKVSSLIKEKYALKTDVTNAVSDRPTVVEMQTYVEQTSEHILSSATKDTTTQLKDYLKTENFSSSIDQHADKIVTTVTSSTTYTNHLSGKANVADLNGLASRVSTAEQKITADAIVSTVTSSETYKNDITGLVSRVANAESSITQHADAIAGKAEQTSVNGLTTRVSSVEAGLNAANAAITLKVSTADFLTSTTGGSNILKKKDYWRNNFVNGVYDLDNSWMTSSYSMSRYGFAAIDSRTIPSTSIFVFGAVRNLKLNRWRKYTLSFTAWCNSPSSTWTETQTFRVDLYPDTLPEKMFTCTTTPTRYTFTFIENNSSDIENCTLRFSCSDKDSSGYTCQYGIYVTDIMLVEGDRPAIWAPNPEDPVQNVKTTTVTIDANGMDVSTGGSVNFHTNLFNITPPDGADQLFSVSALDRTVRAQRGYFDGGLYAPNMASRAKSNFVTVYVGGSGDYPTLQAAWDSLPDVCGEVRINVRGNAPGEAMLKGKQISLLSVCSTSSTKWDVGNVLMWGIHASFINLTLSNHGTNGGDTCRMYSGQCSFENVTFASPNRGLLLYYGAAAFLLDCKIAGIDSVEKMQGYGVEAYASFLAAQNCTGTATSGGLGLFMGAVAALTGTFFGDAINTGGGVCIGNYILDGSTVAKPSVATSKTYTSKACISWMSTSGSRWREVSGSSGQKVESRNSTTSDGFDHRCGWWVLDTGTAIMNDLAGKTITKATLTITRTDIYSDTRTCDLAYHKVTDTKMAGYSGSVASYTPRGNHLFSLGTFNLAPSAPTVITLPSSVYSLLQNGTIKGFGLLNNSTHYKTIMCDSSCTLTVNYK